MFQRRNILMAIDAAIIIFGYYFTFMTILPRYLWGQTFQIFRYTFLIVMVIYITVYIWGGLYRQVWRYADAREYRMCMTYSLLAGAAFILVAGVIRYHVPLRIQLFSPFIIGAFIVTSRMAYKLLRQNRHKTDFTPQASKQKYKDFKRLAIVGAGESGALLYQEIRANPHIKYNPVIFVDDDSSKIGRKLFNVPILGPVQNVESFVDEYKVDEIIIAMPAISGERRKEIAELCNDTSATVKILPSMVITLDNKIGTEEDKTDVLLSKLRNIDVEDLLGREPIKVNDADISSYIEGKHVLVTGGGGSIGSELCRQIVKYKAQKLIILDNHENGAYEIEQELIREHHYTPQVEIIDVKDRDRLERLFQQEEAAGSPIEIIFHAAAHKHVPLMEHNPESAIKNNILGTYHVAQVASKYNVEKMILISTDKAVNPTNVMGATKRACELIIQAMSQRKLKDLKSDIQIIENPDGTTGTWEDRTIFTAVRFGNVLGSNGSVIPLFKKQIENGGPVTVTHPEIIRYFMTIPEAVSLVLNAGGLAKGGEIFVLDMGEPVKIIDLAKNLIKLAGLEVGKDIDIVFTGLRPGEKLYEELLMSEEGLRTTDSAKIFVGSPPKISSDVVLAKICQVQDEIKDEKESNRDATNINYKQWLQSLVDTYHPRT